MLQTLVTNITLYEMGAHDDSDKNTTVGTI